MPTYRKVYELECYKDQCPPSPLSAFAMMFWQKTSNLPVEVVDAQINPVNLDPQAKSVVEKTKEEKRFLLKLDFFLLTYGCLS